METIRCCALLVPAIEFVHRGCVEEQPQHHHKHREFTHYPYAAAGPTNTTALWTQIRILPAARTLDRTAHLRDLAPRVTSRLLALTVLFCLFQAKVLAQSGGYLITQLAITNATHPSINNSGEVVWAVQNGTGIYSSLRGQLSATGVSPHLANSGEVVYADSFEVTNEDLVSSTRGRLTFGGVIQLGFSDFDVNSNGEAVYVAATNGNQQVFSTIRGQITFDPVDHYNPCINDLGEILWNRYGAGPGLVSSTRGPLPGLYPTIYAVNNFDEFCYEGILYDGSLSTSPHIFSSIHGVVINDVYQYQWYGGINDAGTLIWAAPANPSSPEWEIFEATWIASPGLAVVPGNPGLALEWLTDASNFHVQYATNLTPSVIWQRLGGTVTTNSGNFHLLIPQNIGRTVYFRLSTGTP